MENIFMTSDEAAAYLRITRNRLYGIKEIPFYTPGRRRLYKKEDLDNWIERSKRNG